MSVIITTILLIINLIYNHGINAFRLLIQIWSQDKRISNFIKRCCTILPPFLDDLDIFHIQWAKTLVHYPEFIENLQCPVVLSLRGAHINYSPLTDKQLVQGYEKYFPKVAGFHAVSDAIAREAEKYGACPSKITVIRPAVKRKLINDVPLKKTNGSGKILKIISVGRCHWKKGYTFALDTMAILKKEKTSFHYTIIAGGKDHENINYQIHDLGLIEFVTFINGLPHHKVIDKLSSNDLFLLPSLEEGISNAVLEAMALGIPVISTDCGGMAEVINNGENGFIIPVRDSIAMAKIIHTFQNLDEPEKINVINNARETIIHHHQLSDQVDKFSSLYSHILQK